MCIFFINPLSFNLGRFEDTSAETQESLNELFVDDMNNVREAGNARV